MVASMKTQARVVVDALDKIFVDPIRSGRPRPKDWQPGLAPVMALAAAGYLIGVVLVLGAPWLRSADRPVVIERAEIV